MNRFFLFLGPGSETPQLWAATSTRCWGLVLARVYPLVMTQGSQGLLAPCRRFLPASVQHGASPGRNGGPYGTEVRIRQCPLPVMYNS
ncbi:hypothetical protein ASPFODRAFT_555085 [Aspergillus luchuensis CBS 106.47]|uniref:Uncharacterized protein n=1 Tax=Aspergillus luchuensis (strain CBS 106.47) TaxID=1137211 RepID=A0A1M3TPP8_ASPLC|nr:hypothetical protein ASPFODRAFT_555085 [Aspergillus luchuensis CBS 106.47]